jgi:RNA polymerase sigma-70 factor (ECF subfamily)
MCFTSWVRGRTEGEGTGKLALREEELTSLCDDVDLDRDRALVERCQAGDSAAFGNLYARYYERLLRFCLRRLNDRHEAEDAAQEAFARAWKALPRFAGERRFYPWLTVIAGNICTDMLRRRSRSTPTDDMELTAQRPVGVVGEDTSEELVLAAVDGELVNRALDRLSTRHRHVLAMREGSGWTYQQIADHEGVEIGTIETLLWRARQALKREFAAVSESKEALAGFLIATGALIRRTIFRAAHRSASIHHNGSGSGALRNAVTGAAVTGAAVAAAFIAPHALSSGPSSAAAAPGSAVIAAPPLALGATHFGPENGSGAGTQTLALSASTDGSGNGPGAGDGVSSTGSGGGSGGGGSKSGVKSAAGGAGGAAALLSGALGGGSSSGSSGLSAGLNKTAGGVKTTVGGAAGGLGQTVGGVTGGVTKTVTGVTKTVGGVTKTVGGVTQAVSGVSSTVGTVASGVGQTVSGVTGGVKQTVSGVSGTVGSVGGLNNTLGGVTSSVNGITQSVGLGSVVPGASTSGSSSGSGSGSSSSSAAPATTTTTTTNPVQGIVGGATKTVGGLLGG